MSFISATKFVIFFAASINAQKVEQDHSVVNRVSNIAEKYSNWALGKSDYRNGNLNNFQVTQVQSPPRNYNTAPVKRFFHQVRIQPPLIIKPVTYSETSYQPIDIYSTTQTPILTTPPYPSRISHFPTENRQIFRSPVRQHYQPSPNFPRLLETEVPVSQSSPMFTSNSSLLPPHMSQNFGSSILTQLLNPILQEPNIPTAPPNLQISPQMHINPNFPTLVPLPIPQPVVLEPTKEEVMKIASKKNLYGMPRFPIEPHRGFFQASMSCMDGWCGNECCEPRRPFAAPTTTIQASVLPGSPSPPHPLVLVVHPAPQAQCSPACQPHCSQQCVARLQYMHESQFYNHILEPSCRPDCMPSCHVDCLIIPPQQVRCNSFNCQCLAGYVQCAAFTCCMRYPNLAARMKSNVMAKSSEEEANVSEEGKQDNEISYRRMYTPNRMRAGKGKYDIENVTSPPVIRPSYWTKHRVKSTKEPKTTIFTTTPVPCPTTTSTTTSATTLVPTTSSSTTTTTTTTPVPVTSTTTEPTTTTYTTSTSTSTTTTLPPTTSTPKIVVNLTPIYPDMLMKANKVPMIPAYGIWTIPPHVPPSSKEFDNPLSGIKTSPTEKRNSIGDIRGRHVIRSENFLDVLSELAQVKLKEDITDDFSHAANFIDFMTDRFSKI
ncbi:EB domain-containing protein [Caenorhabditis elegans]|uniref:EB domain-containing protein n=1 Tax=Caenorhabditis elegans TaxID=6239 RepID=Q23036_CAEEL|nr:EB domain-containing protein [Caenorhabditis elegans]CCD64170.2 EB domain-containing protein [Caenorhabditis elegans]|eukprot:NP_001343619.1 Uncharacterized protein CELE_T09D3.3 [Caenorhabditis elegans]